MSKSTSMIFPRTLLKDNLLKSAMSRSHSQTIYINRYDGRPDWGQAKIVDNPSWSFQNKKWAVSVEMPHYYYGTHQKSSLLC